MGTFKKGVVVGGLLSAAVMYIHTSKRGKQLRQEFMTHADLLQKELMKKMKSPKVKAALNKSAYLVMVRDVVEGYVEKYHLDDAAKRLLASALEADWNSLKPAAVKKVVTPKKQSTRKKSA